MSLIFPPELRCTPGQTDKPTAETCERHSDHYWCGTCQGWYGVPHNFGMHNPGHGHDGVSWTRGCACRPCQTRQRESEGSGDG